MRRGIVARPPRKHYRAGRPRRRIVPCYPERIGEPPPVEDLELGGHDRTGILKENSPAALSGPGGGGVECAVPVDHEIEARRRIDMNPGPDAFHARRIARGNDVDVVIERGLLVTLLEILLDVDPGILEIALGLLPGLLKRLRERAAVGDYLDAPPSAAARSSAARARAFGDRSGLRDSGSTATL